MLGLKQALLTSESSSLSARAESQSDICNLIKFPLRTENFKSFAKLSRICGDKDLECILVS